MPSDATARDAAATTRLTSARVGGARAPQHQRPRDPGGGGASAPTAPRIPRSTSGDVATLKRMPADRRRRARATSIKQHFCDAAARSVARPPRAPAGSPVWDYSRRHPGDMLARARGSAPTRRKLAPREGGQVRRHDASAVARSSECRRRRYSERDSSRRRRRRLLLRRARGGGAEGGTLRSSQRAPHAPTRTHPKAARLACVLGHDSGYANSGARPPPQATRRRAARASKAISAAPGSSSGALLGALLAYGLLVVARAFGA